jgi:Lantibiotic biosynthesis dehydratase C-term
MTSRAANGTAEDVQPSGQEWRSVHVYYHGNGSDDLILSAVQPLLAATKTSVNGAYFLRHWRQGPHVRINLRSDQDTWSATVKPAVKDIIGEFLRCKPSIAALDERTQLPGHRVLATREHERGPLEPWYPNNSIQYLPHDDRRHVLGSEQASDLLIQFYCDTTELAFEMLRMARSGTDRLMMSLDLMFAVANTMFPPITRGFISYRSHAEAFLARTGKAVAAREVFERRYQEIRSELACRLRAVLSTLDGSPQPVPFVREWTAVMQRYRARGEALIRSGNLSFATPPGTQGPPELSEFHSLLVSSGAYDALSRSTSFLCYRLILNYTYLHLTRLGVRPIDRFLLCHLAANAVEDAFGVSAMDIRRTRGWGNLE